jgi:hypothetical protein
VVAGPGATVVVQTAQGAQPVQPKTQTSTTNKVQILRRNKTKPGEGPWENGTLGTKLPPALALGGNKQLKTSNIVSITFDEFPAPKTIDIPGFLAIIPAGAVASVEYASDDGAKKTTIRLSLPTFGIDFDQGAGVLESLNYLSVKSFRFK